MNVTLLLHFLHKLSWVRKSASVTLFFRVIFSLFHIWYFLPPNFIFNQSEIKWTCASGLTPAVFQRYRSGTARPLRLLQREISNFRVDTSSLQLSLPGTVCALHQGEIYYLLPVQGFTALRSFYDGVMPKPFFINSIMQLDRIPKSTNLHQCGTVLSTCSHEIDFLTLKSC